MSQKTRSYSTHRIIPQSIPDHSPLASVHPSPVSHVVCLPGPARLPASPRPVYRYPETAVCRTHSGGAAAVLVERINSYSWVRFPLESPLDFTQSETTVGVTQEYGQMKQLVIPSTVSLSGRSVFVFLLGCIRQALLCTGALFAVWVPVTFT